MKFPTLKILIRNPVLQRNPECVKSYTMAPLPLGRLSCSLAVPMGVCTSGLLGEQFWWLHLLPATTIWSPVHLQSECYL